MEEKEYQEYRQSLFYETYKKVGTVKAKLFMPGDEDGFTIASLGLNKTTEVPYINSIECQKFVGEFGLNYVCVGIKNERWLVAKDIFEKTYKICRNIEIKISRKAKIISGFPGVGKSYIFNNYQSFIQEGVLRILDSDSSTFDKTLFPGNYIEHITENKNKTDLIFVSSHKVVRDAMLEAGIEFILVYPAKYLKSEYIKRYKQRGSPEGFIKLIDANWDNWIDEIEKETGYEKIILQSTEYLEDIINFI